MPKEITHDDSGVFDVVVGWNPTAEFMQLGLQVADRRALVTQMYGDRDTLIKIGRSFEQFANWPTPVFDSAQAVDDWLAEKGREVLDLVEGSSVGINSGDPRTSGFDSIWSTLSREGCNRLIRNLRKARDAAFGKDE